ncbi:enoyl-CoA hydratase/isomerase family protein [Pararhodobacter sp. SW119]|uniref:enoyl-CoA hydratase/isomerase family protein n=1 Tax=Pararhodobacter sp. SW119 TaxID=2780075 RepID=UPI001ADF2A99|nr:enoyl-CoA hydratase/isomerase family protein [Pararhodobacter sp. SW119]
MNAVLFDQRDGVAVLTLNRPDRSNALTDDLLDALHTALDRLNDPRALVLRGAGRHFSTGGDVARFAAEVAAGTGRAYADHVVGGLNRAILRLAALPCPVIAQVKGALTGGALGLVLAADLVAMDRTAFIQPYYVRVGFAPDGGWTAMLPARIGAARARAIQLLNTRLSAAEALQLNLAQSVSDDPGAVVDTWLAQLEGKDAGAMAATKRLLAPADLEAGLEAERRAFLARIETPEVRAGMQRFLDTIKHPAQP